MNDGAFNATLPVIILWEYLREQAHRCVRLVRHCADQQTSHALEAMGVELLEKANELEEMNSIPGNE